MSLHYSILNVRLFSVMSGTLVGWVLPLCKDAVSLFCSPSQLSWDGLVSYLGHSFFFCGGGWSYALCRYGVGILQLQLTGQIIFIVSLTVWSDYLGLFVFLIKLSYFLTSVKIKHFLTPKSKSVEEQVMFLFLFEKKKERFDLHFQGGFKALSLFLQ